MSLTSAQRRALEFCAEGLTPTACIAQHIRRDVIARLDRAGLIRFRPYSRDPHWITTEAGMESLQCANDKYSFCPQCKRKGVYFEARSNGEDQYRCRYLKSGDCEFYFFTLGSDRDDEVARAQWREVNHLPSSDAARSKSPHATG